MLVIHLVISSFRSLPPLLSPSRPPSLLPSVSPSLPPSFPHSFPPPSLPPSLLPSLPPSLPISCFRALCFTSVFLTANAILLKSNLGAFCRFPSLNVTKDANVTKRAFEICGYLADATTAKKIPLSDVYFTVNTTVNTIVHTTVNTTVNTTVHTTKPMNKKPTQGASCVIMSFAFLYFMLFLSSTYVTSS